MEGAVILRTLTRKSILWFGKHNGMTVQQILDLHYGTYLRYIYYNVAGVSFCNDILDEITIRENRRIKKPGSAPEMHTEICEENLKKLSFKSRMHYNKVNRIKKEILEIKSDRNAVEHKGVLQAYNHNKMKNT